MPSRKCWKPEIGLTCSSDNDRRKRVVRLPDIVQRHDRDQVLGARLKIAENSRIDVGRVHVHRHDLRVAIGLVPEAEVLIHAAVKSGNPVHEDRLVRDVDHLK